MRAREVVGWEWEGLHRTSFTELYFGGILFIKKCYLLLNASFG